jgi:hypothetical protein
LVSSQQAQALPPTIRLAIRSGEPLDELDRALFVHRSTVPSTMRSVPTTSTTAQASGQNASVA